MGIEQIPLRIPPYIRIPPCCFPFSNKGGDSYINLAPQAKILMFFNLNYHENPFRICICEYKNAKIFACGAQKQQF